MVLKSFAGDSAFNGFIVADGVAIVPHGRRARPKLLVICLRPRTIQPISSVTITVHANCRESHAPTSVLGNISRIILTKGTRVYESHPGTICTEVKSSVSLLD